MENITTEKTTPNLVWNVGEVVLLNCIGFVLIFIFFSSQIEIEEMSPAVTSSKKRKAAEIDTTNQSKEEQTAKAKKNDSGGRKYRKSNQFLHRI